MVSCRQRADTERPETLASLALASVAPVVFECACNPAGPAANRHTAYHAITSGKGEVLYVEDDIIAKPDLLRYVALARLAQRITTFCVLRDRLYPSGFNPLDARARLVELDPKVVPMDRRRDGQGGFYGTQAVYLPAHVVIAIREAESDFVNPDGSMQPDSGDGLDFWLKRHAAELGGILAAYPNPVQHRNPAKMKFVTRGIPTADNPHVHRSSSFDTEAQWTPS